MKTLFLTLVTVLIYCSATCQTLQNDKIIGEWTVKNSQLIAEMGLDKEQSQQMESLRKGFIGSTFVFKADRIFQIKFPATANNFMKELAMLNNKNGN